MKIIHKEQTYTNDCTSSGYDIEIRDDNTMRVTSRSCWRGSRTKEVWIVPTPQEVLDAIENEKKELEDEQDIQTALYEWLETDWKADEATRKIRSGYTVG